MCLMSNRGHEYTYSLSSCSSGYSSSSFKSASDQLVSSQNSPSKHKHMTTTLQCPSQIPSHQNIPSGTAPFAWTLSSSTLSPDTVRSRLMSALWKELGTGGGGGGLLNAMQMCVVGAAKKNYSLAPCHHLFHTECLEWWLAIKVRPSFLFPYLSSVLKTSPLSDQAKNINFGSNTSFQTVLYSTQFIPSLG